MNTSQISDNEIARALDNCCAQIKNTLSTFSSKSQNHSSINNFYPVCENDQWTSGFYPGELWLCYEYTKDDDFKAAALNHVSLMKYRIDNKIAVDHHDMGFLYTPSCVSAYKITSDILAKESAIKAADQLISRFQEKGQFIQAWGEMGQKENYRYIIDCLLNTPLLYWATEVTGDNKYKDIAIAHTKTCMSHSIRENGSTYHTFFMDPKTGEGICGRTCQGYNDDSFWARGQAWAIYGSALAFRYTNNPEYINIFRKTLDFFMSKLPKDKVPYWDMIFNEFNGAEEPRDSSSAAIVTCGLFEMANTLCKTDPERYGNLICKYNDMAFEILRNLIANYSILDPTKSNGLLMHGTYSKKSPYNTCTEEGVDECTSWGDYFYLEALMRAYNPKWVTYW